MLKEIVISTLYFTAVKFAHDAWSAIHSSIGLIEASKKAGIKGDITDYLTPYTKQHILWRYCMEEEGFWKAEFTQYPTFRAIYQNIKLFYQDRMKR